MGIQEVPCYPILWWSFIKNHELQTAIKWLLEPNTLKRVISCSTELHVVESRSALFCQLGHIWGHTYRRYCSGPRHCWHQMGLINWSSPAILSVLARHLNGISHNTDDWKLRPPDVSPLLNQEMPIILVRLVIRKSHLQVSWPVHFFFFEDLDVKSVQIYEN